MANTEKPSNSPSTTPSTAPTAAPAETQAALANTSAEVNKDIAEKQTVKDLEDLAKDVQLSRLKEAEQSAVQAIQALPNNLDPEKATKEQLDTLDTFHMGGLFMIREILQGQPEIKADNIAEFFKADISKFKDTEKAIWNKLKNIAANKDKYPKLYQDLFGQWAEGIALMKQKVEAEKTTTAATAEEKAEGDKEKDTKDGTLFDKVLEVAKKNPLLATVGAVGIGIALYNMWKNGGWQKGIVIGLFAMVGLGALTSDSVKGIFQKMGVNTDKEDDKDKNSSSSTNDDPNTPDTPQNSPAESKEKEGWKPLKEVYAKTYDDWKGHIDGIKEWMKDNSGATALGGALLSTNDIARHFMGDGLSMGVTTMLSLGKLSFGTVSSHPLGSIFAITAFMMHKDKVLENVGEIRVPGTPEELKKYLLEQKDEINKFCKERDLTPFQEKDVDKVVDVMSGKVTIEQLLPKNMAFGEVVAKSIVDRVGMTPLKAIQSTYRDGFRKLSSYLEKSAKKETDNSSALTSMQKKIEALYLKSQGNGVTVKDIEELNNMEELALLGMKIYPEDGYLRISRVDVNGIVLEGFPKNIGIDPNLHGKEAVEKALKFMNENTWTQLLNIPLKEMQFSAEQIVSNLHNGWQLAIMGGQVYMLGATERYLLGGVHALKSLFDFLSKKKEFSVVEGLQDYAYGILPVVFMGTVSSLTRLRNPFVGKGWIEPLVRGALYPLASLDTLRLLIFKDIVPHALHGEFNKILSNPKNIIRTDIMQRVRKVQGIYYERTTFMNQSVHGNMATKLNASSDFYESLRLLYSVENKSGKQTVIDTVNHVLDRNHLYSRKITIDNYKQAIEEIEKLAKTSEQDMRNILRLHQGKPKIQPMYKVNTKQPLDVAKAEKQFGTLANEVMDPAKRTPEKLREMAKNKALSNPLEAMENLKNLEKGIANGLKLEEAAAQFKGYEEGINEVVTRQMADAKRRMNLPSTDTSRLTDDQIKSVLNRLDSTYLNPFKEIKKGLNTAMNNAFNALDVKPKGLSKAINDAFRPKSGNILTHVVQGTLPGRVTMFGLQAGLMVGAMKTAEYFMTPPEQRDLMKTISSIASPETVQLLVDIAPYSGTASNAVSLVTGRKSLEPLANMVGTEFQDGSVDRMETAAWLAISAAGDFATLIPVLGWGAKAGLITTKLGSVVAKGGKMGKAAEEVLRVWPKIAKFAEKYGWDKAMQTTVEALQNNRQHLRNINLYGSLGGAAITVAAAGYNMVYNKPVELTLLPEEDQQSNTPQPAREKAAA